MDIDLLSKMVAELILDNDEVTLPGVGTFVAEEVPSTFSDKGYTINPPYRKLSFRQKETRDTILVDFYARTNDLDIQTASSILLKFLSEMKEVLQVKKTVIFPGLGRLRATKENAFFFVPDEELNIYPDGFGLESVSLKTHVETEVEVQEAMEGLQSIMDSESPESMAVDETEQFQEEDAFEIEPVTDQPAEAVQPEGTPSPVSMAEKAEVKAQPEPKTKEGLKKMPLGWKIVCGTVAAAAVFIIVFLALAHLAPDFMDSLLYSPEELQIIRSFQL